MNDEDLKKLIETVTKSPEEEVVVTMFLASLMAGMKYGNQILENMTEEEKEALRKKLSP